MKVIAVIALFALVAVQLSHSLPVPDDDRADKAVEAMKKNDAPAAPVAAAAETAPVVAAEAKHQDATPDVAVKAEEPAPAPAPAAVAVEKKE